MVSIKVIDIHNPVYKV